MAKAEELRLLGADELTEKLGQLKKSLMQHRFQAKTGKLETKSVIKIIKHDIARTLTVMNEKKNQK